MAKTLRKPAHQARLRPPPPQSTESLHRGQIRADRRDDRQVALWAVGRKLARLQQRCRGEKGSAGLPSFSRSVAPDTEAVAMKSRASNSDRKAKAVMPPGGSAGLEIEFRVPANIAQIQDPGVDFVRANCGARFRQEALQPSRSVLQPQGSELRPTNVRSNPGHRRGISAGRVERCAPPEPG